MIRDTFDDGNTFSLVSVAPYQNLSSPRTYLPCRNGNDGFSPFLNKSNKTNFEVPKLNKKCMLQYNLFIFLHACICKRTSINPKSETSAVKSSLSQQLRAVLYLWI